MIGKTGQNWRANAIKHDVYKTAGPQEELPLIKISPLKARQTFSIFNKTDNVGDLNGSSYKP